MALQFIFGPLGQENRTIFIIKSYRNPWNIQNDNI